MMPRLGLFALALPWVDAMALPQDSAAMKDSARVQVERDSAASRASGDSAKAEASEDTSSAPTVYEYIANPALQWITWPIETLLAPTVSTLTYPIKPPLRYFMDQNVLDRTIDLLSFGPQSKIMVYPTMSIAPGTGSRTGLTLRHMALFGRPSERLVGQWIMYVNGDYRLRAYMTARDLFGTGYSGKFSATMNRVKNTSANQPGSDAFWYYSDTSETYAAYFGHDLIEKFTGRLNYALRVNRFGLAPPADPKNSKLVSSFFDPPGEENADDNRQYRGLESEWVDHMIGFSLGRDTRNNENITLDGSRLDAGWSYHFTTADHDYHHYQVIWDKFFKLGSERYEVTREEEKAGAKGMNIKDFLAKLEYKKLREQIFNRKVLAFRAYVAQSFEVPGNRMPIYGLQTLGNDTPMRGYQGSRFRDLAVAAVSSEYRFPLMRLVDGDIFNEYGIYGKDWESLDADNLKNSWGFGIRVRRPDIFLFRCEAGFHGSDGVVLNLTVDAAY